MLLLQQLVLQLQVLERQQELQLVLELQELQLVLELQELQLQEQLQRVLQESPETFESAG